MTRTSSTEKQALPSTSVLVTPGISTIGILAISIVCNFSPCPSISTIISIPGMQSISARTVETKPQPSTNFLGKGKENEEEIDLDEEILIPNWDISKLNLDQM